jgi:hypothetical protein
MAEAETALEQAKSLTWGTYGCGAVEEYEKHGTRLPPIVWKPLGDLDTDHLEAILAHLDKKNFKQRELIGIAVTLVLEDRRG